jgi:hypothetical protein
MNIFYGTYKKYANSINTFLTFFKVNGKKQNKKTSTKNENWRK